MIYEFALCHNTAETTKSICCVEGESTVDHSIVSRWLKKFQSGCKKFDDQTRSGWSKTEFWGCAPSHKGKSGK